MSEFHSPPAFWQVVRLLLRTARQRAAGRRRRQQELLQSRSRGSSTDWSAVGLALATLLMIIVNVLAAFDLLPAVETGERLQAERQGKIVVSRSFFDAANAIEMTADNPLPVPGTVDDQAYSIEARQTAERYGGSRAAIEQKLRTAVGEHGARDLIAEDEASPKFNSIESGGPVAAMLGSMVLLCWAAMLIFQGEGLELDIQRSRHPMWEWLFSHPVPPGAVFFAEMLSPIAANPLYWGAPLFVGVVYGLVYGLELGVAAVFFIGVPLTIAAACLGKAFEIGAVLRLSSRSRGAVIGLMSWVGYASMMLLLLGYFYLPKAIEALSRFLVPLSILPWPWFRLFVGRRIDGSFSFAAGLLTCWAAAGIMTAAAVWFSVWGAQRGLSGNFAAAARPSAPKRGGARFGKDPLYRKEFLWFIRDRSAIVQTILIPLTVAGVQVFNLRGLLGHAQDAWNYLCGAAILFGTYFLWVLGPKSLQSEGQALWIALTWPRGLESLLKAKAWLWSLISTGLVALVLGYAGILFPADLWKIALAGVAWFIFGRSMAEKSVTLVSVQSSSGETEKIPRGRRWATQLGMLTFSIGVLTQQWHIAVMGIVYSYVTAAAMWQNFRARLPYLYDPWSERIPPPPTLMHAMIAISILVESGAVAAGLLLAVFGREYLGVAQAISYGICAVAVSIGVSNFLSNRNVSPWEVWYWPRAAIVEPAPGRWWLGYSPMDSTLFTALLAAAGGGLLLGLFAHGYLAVLAHIPAAAEIIRRSNEQLSKIPYLRGSYAVMAVLFAPFAEEYLFRGLLYRALDREWGGWRAVIGSAAFFAVYHPPLSWLPVFLLGVYNAILFKKSGRLAPAVLLHMVYNAVVLS